MTTACPVLDTLQSVELAEGVEIRLRIAGPLPRTSAFLIDFLIRLLLFTALAIGSFLMGFAFGGNVSQGLILLGWFLIDWLYPVLFEAGRRGATPGKRIMNLRVVQASGSPLTFGQAVVRNFLRFVDCMPLFTYGFGMASCVATRRFQRLGDLAAGTLVVYARVPVSSIPVSAAAIDALPVPMALSADEIRALALFEERAALWSPARREEIANRASALSGTTGNEGVRRLLGMARWLRDKRN